MTTNGRESATFVPTEAAVSTVEATCAAKATGDPLLLVEHVSKSFVSSGFRELCGLRRPRVVRALDDVSLSIKRGSVTALLGPNGAGKTTLLKSLCDLVRPDRGRITIAGLTMPQQGRLARQQLGVVTANDRSFFWRLTGRQNLKFFAALQNLPLRQASALTNQVLSDLQMDSYADRPFGAYSSGMKKRLAIARAILHCPRVLLMDEATSGLDPPAAADLIRFIQEHVKSGERCVLWATHLIDEVWKLCDRVVMLIDGRVCFADSADAFSRLCRQHSGYLIDIEVVAGQTERLTRFVESTRCGVEWRDGYARLSLDGIGAETVSRTLQSLLNEGNLIRAINPAPIEFGRLFQQLSRS